MGTFDGQIAFITGGARGQGRSHAVHLASLGADIVIVDSIKDNVTTPYGMATQADLDETVRLVEAQGRKAYARAIDVRDLNGLIAFADEVVERYGKIDILLANAGIMTAVPIAEMSGEVWAETVDINLTGVFNSFRAVLPHMVKAGYGRVVATSSGGGHIGFNNLAHYCAAKGGIVSLTRALAQEAAPKGVLVNAIAPGPIDTDMLRGFSADWRAWKQTQLPLGRFGTVDEVAPTALLLASAAGANYVGQTLSPNGGDVFL